MNPTQMLTELKRQADSKEDFIVPANAMTLNPDGTLNLAGMGRDHAADDLDTLLAAPRNTGDDVVGNIIMPVGDHAQKQLATYLGIPQKYYARMAAERPELLARNVNEWLEDKAAAGDRRMVRCLDGKVRAVLSSRYRIMDNLDLVAKVAPEFQALGCIPFRAHLSDTNLHLTVVHESIIAELPAAPDSAWGSDSYRQGVGGYSPIRTLQASLTIKNSEVGNGRYTVSPSIVDRACRNLSVLGTAVAKMHLGRAHADDGLLQDILSDEARQADDAALWLAVRDTIRATFNPQTFQAIVDKFKGLRAVAVAEPVQTIKRIAAREAINEDVLLESYFGMPEPTAFGIQSAITLAAQKVSNEEDAAALERAGGRMLEADTKTLDGYFNSEAKSTRLVDIVMVGADGTEVVA